MKYQWWKWTDKGSKEGVGGQGIEKVVVHKILKEKVSAGNIEENMGGQGIEGGGSKEGVAIQIIEGEDEWTKNRKRRWADKISKEKVGKRGMKQKH